MKKVLWIIAVSVLGILLQGTLFKALHSSTPTPNVTALIVFALGLSMSDVKGASLAFFSGILLDLFASPQIVGPSAFASVFTFVFTVLASRHIFLHTNFGSFIGGCVASIVFSSSFLVVLGMFTSIGIGLYQLSVALLVEGVLSGLFRIGFCFPIHAQS